MQAAIQGKIVMKEEFKITQSREYGASFACVAIIKALGLHKAIFSRPSDITGIRSVVMSKLLYRCFARKMGVL